MRTLIFRNYMPRCEELRKLKENMPKGGPLPHEVLDARVAQIIAHIKQQERQQVRIPSCHHTHAIARVTRHRRRRRCK